MKKKDIIKREELERINDELFGPFDPGDESSIGGDRTTNTSVYTYSPSGPDAMLDLDFWEFETQQNPGTN